MKKTVPLLILLSIFVNQMNCFAVGKDDTSANFPADGIPVLMYHSIGSKYQCSICVSEKEFADQMRWLYENGYNSLKLEEFYEALSGSGKLPEKPVLITFDDGFTDNYRVAWPILKQFGFNATFFIVTNQIDPYNLKWDDLKELVREGNSIGSHTLDHRDLSMLNVRDQEREIRQSKEILEKNLGYEVKAFCFPYGKYNKTTLTLLPESGYKLAFTTQTGKVCYGDDRYLLKRVHIWGGKPISTFVGQVASK